MNEDIISLFLLKELIPFYSIAFAVNMAFGFWDSLRDVHIKKFDKMSKDKTDSFKNALKINKSDNNSCLDEFKKEISTKKENLESISIYGKFACGVMCIFIAASIAYIGMYPDSTLNFTFTILSVIGSLLPFSLMMVTSSLYSKKSLAMINDASENQIKGMRSVISGLSNNYQNIPE
jgi:hypothetical protein